MPEWSFIEALESASPNGRMLLTLGFGAFVLGVHALFWGIAVCLDERRYRREEREAERRGRGA